MKPKLPGGQDAAHQIGVLYIDDAAPTFGFELEFVRDEYMLEDGKHWLVQGDDFLYPLIRHDLLSYAEHMKKLAAEHEADYAVVVENEDVGKLEPNEDSPLTVRVAFKKLGWQFWVQYDPGTLEVKGMPRTLREYEKMEAAFNLLFKSFTDGFAILPFTDEQALTSMGTDLARYATTGARVKRFYDLDVGDLRQQLDLTPAEWVRHAEASKDFKGRATAIAALGSAPLNATLSMRKCLAFASLPVKEDATPDIPGCTAALTELFRGITGKAARFFVGADPLFAAAGHVHIGWAPPFVEAPRKAPSFLLKLTNFVSFAFRALDDIGNAPPLWLLHPSEVIAKTFAAFPWDTASDELMLNCSKEWIKLFQETMHRKTFVIDNAVESDKYQVCSLHYLTGSCFAGGEKQALKVKTGAPRISELGGTFEIRALRAERSFAELMSILELFDCVIAYAGDRPKLALDAETDGVLDALTGVFQPSEKEAALGWCGEDTLYEGTNRACHKMAKHLSKMQKANFEKELAAFVDTRKLKRWLVLKAFFEREY